jgi:hypothetical protein
MIATMVISAAAVVCLIVILILPFHLYLKECLPQHRAVEAIPSRFNSLLESSFIGEATIIPVRNRPVEPAVSISRHSGSVKFAHSLRAFAPSFLR